MVSVIQQRDLEVSEEPARLAGEIHGALLRDLSLLTLQVQSLERTGGLTGAIQAEILAAAEQVRVVLQSVQRSLWDLVPSPLDGRDLVTALEDQLDRFCEATGLRGRVTVLGEARPLSKVVEVGIACLMQEALANLRRQARGHRIALRLQYDDAAVIFTIEDDVGDIVPSGQASVPAADGTGLPGMRECVRLLGGTLDVASPPGRGTQVTAILPYTVPHAGRHNCDDGCGEIRVVVVDEHAVARQGVRRMLEGQSNIMVVGEAATSREAAEQIEKQHPDVLLLDLQMSHVDGIETLRWARRTHPALGVIILTTLAQDEHVFVALREGARGYLLKDTSPEDLTKAVQLVAAGGTHWHSTVAGMLMGRLQRRDVLTVRELEVLRLVDEGLRSKEIAARLVVSERTVGFHLNHVYGKLGASGRTEALRIARARGLLLS